MTAMDPFLVEVFAGQVRLQCQFIVMAAEALSHALRSGDTTQTFHAVQGLLSAAANVQKALWGQGGRRQADREVLRQHLGIEENSPFRQMGMRDNFDHFDERLEEWWRQSKSQNYVDLNVGNVAAALTGTEEIDVFRNLDPATMDLVFWGDTFNIAAIVAAAQQILRQAPNI
ncbi:MAG: hypothetical protein Q8M79_10360 [Dehalococcoidia bacterium]|nr:hypothetical protein [Dehalococcoidia bacterium]